MKIKKIKIVTILFILSVGLVNLSQAQTDNSFEDNVFNLNPGVLSNILNNPVPNNTLGVGDITTYQYIFGNDIDNSLYSESIGDSNNVTKGDLKLLTKLTFPNTPLANQGNAFTDIATDVGISFFRNMFFPNGGLSDENRGALSTSLGNITNGLDNIAGENTLGFDEAQGLSVLSTLPEMFDIFLNYQTNPLSDMVATTLFK